MDLYLALMAVSFSALAGMISYRYLEISRGSIDEYDIEEHHLYSRYVVLRTSRALIYGGREHLVHFMHKAPRHPLVAKAKDRIGGHIAAQYLYRALDAIRGRRSITSGVSVSHFLQHIAEHKKSLRSDAAPTIVMTGTVVETGPSEVSQTDFIEIKREIEQGETVWH